MSNDTDAHDGGLGPDLEAMLSRLQSRRSALRLLGVSGVGLLAGACGGGGASQNATTSTSAGDAGSGSSACSVTVAETEGPYPADGSNASNGVIRNALATSGVVRSDIRASFGGLSANVAAGLPVTLAIRLMNTNASCGPLAGYAIYVWHCTQAGQYSLYDLPGENYLRGVQVADADGLASFTTIFPGCYSGRWPHIHFEIYPSLATASSYAGKVLTSQFALPSAACNTVYNMASGYAASRSNFQSLSLSSDTVFGNNTAAQIAAMTPVFSGDAASGYAAAATVGLAR